MSEAFKKNHCLTIMNCRADTDTYIRTHIYNIIIIIMYNNYTIMYYNIHKYARFGFVMTCIMSGLINAPCGKLAAGRKRARATSYGCDGGEVVKGFKSSGGSSASVAAGGSRRRWGF